ncbi:MAG: hypothetical protein R3C05_10185 [Pirellulaceae bacterium]
MTDHLGNEDRETLRNEIWDFVYRSGQPQTVASIVDDLQLNDQTVREVVHDAWFKFDGENVAIA